MTAYSNEVHGRSKTRSALKAVSLSIGAALALTVCTPSEILEVQDPDIINPSDVQSPAGANAVRLGALSRLNTATSGGTTDSEGIFLLSGLFADEWINGDSFIARQEIDQRVITEQNTFLTFANRQLHRSRLAAEQAVGLIEQFLPTAPKWQLAEMHFVQAYIINLMAEHYCDGLVFSTVVDGREQFGTPITTAAAFQEALQHADAGIALITGTTADDQRVKNALLITRGRILFNLNRPVDAATAVTGVPTTFKYNMLHSATTVQNYTWQRNNTDRRYSVSNNEGGTGMNFATAADPRIPVCNGGDPTCRAIGVTQTNRDDLAQPFIVQRIWPARESPVAIVDGIEARLIEAEAQLRANNAAGALTTLNAARTTVTGLTPLTDAGTDDARISQLFRERAFWLFGRGHRVGAMRRLIRQYNRPANTVFPTGAWHKAGNYGVDVTIPIPQAERNNPNVAPGGDNACLNRNP
jgi:hypothetical protein